MSDTCLPGHHVIEQAAYGRSELLQVLSERGLFELHGPHNILNLPADKALAAKMEVVTSPGRPARHLHRRARTTPPICATSS